MDGTADSTTVVSADSNGLAVKVNTALPSGSNLIGKTGIDQTTPGTTNAVAVAQLGANTISVGNGVSGTGVQRVTLASDSTGTVAATQSGTWTVQPGNTANTTAWKVDGSAVTQPVSASSLPLPLGASTAAKQPALGTAGTASSDVITIQGIASMTKLLVTPDANHSVNVNQLAGTTVDTNSGSKSAGTLRVVLATDQPALTNKLLVTPDANSAVNVAQMNGVNVSMGAGATGTGVQRIIPANDNGKTIVATGGAASSSGNNTLVAAGTNKLKVKAFSLSTTSTTAVTCIFQSGASGTELWRVILQAPSSVSTGANLSTPAPDYLFATAPATLLNLNLSSAVTVHWSVSYFDEA